MAGLVAVAQRLFPNPGRITMSNKPIRSVLPRGISSRVITLGAFMLAVIAACQGDNVTGPGDTGTKLPDSPLTISAFMCSANIRAESVSCVSADDPFKPTLPNENSGYSSGHTRPGRAVEVKGSTRRPRIISRCTHGPNVGRGTAPHSV